VTALALHRRVFDPEAPAPPAAPTKRRTAGVGKAVLFAREPFHFPREGPWQPADGGPPKVDVLPAFADVPRAGQPIARGRPVLSFFAAGGSPEECLGRLRDAAADLDRRLFGR
jgi:hypothetical protein